MSIEFSLIQIAEFKLKLSKLLLGFEYEFEPCSPFLFLVLYYKTASIEFTEVQL